MIIYECIECNEKLKYELLGDLSDVNYSEANCNNCNIEYSYSPRNDYMQFYINNYNVIIKSYRTFIYNKPESPYNVYTKMNDVQSFICSFKNKDITNIKSILESLIFQ